MTLIGHRKKNKKNILLIVFISLLGLCLIGGVIFALNLATIPQVTPESPEPLFSPEGSLSFFDSETKTKIQTIEIEIADNKSEISQGLMFRRSMDADQGMLFIMEKSEPQSFWMANTYIPLDIIFVDSEKNIVNIEAQTEPLSTRTILSGKPAEYVVEVLANFCQKYQIYNGDKIIFERH